jgi:3-phenylpropionate/trans-cinnamate dioxygenase ferredoxin reductase component
MHGQDMAYNRVPHFSTDQYEPSMEYSGYVEPDGYDQVVFRGDTDKLEFIALWLAGGRMLAGMNVNVWDVADSIGALVRSAKLVDRTSLADPGCRSKRSSTTDRPGNPPR